MTHLKNLLLYLAQPLQSGTTLGCNMDDKKKHKIVLGLDDEEKDMVMEFLEDKKMLHCLIGKLF